MNSRKMIRSLSTYITEFVNDESGAELVEAVLVLGLIAVACLIGTKPVSQKIGIYWNDIFSAQ